MHYQKTLLCAAPNDLMLGISVRGGGSIRAASTQRDQNVFAGPWNNT